MAGQQPLKQNFHLAYLGDEKESRAPPQRPTAAILYSNPLGSPCTLTLSGDLHRAIQVLKNRLTKT